MIQQIGYKKKNEIQTIFDWKQSIRVLFYIPTPKSNLCFELEMSVGFRKERLFNQ